MTGPTAPGDGGTPMRGVWVAAAILVGAAVILLVLVLTSGVLGS